MANNDEINVEYDTRGVNVPVANTTGFSNNLSTYLYPKLNNIDNNNEFSNEEINEFSLDVENGKINISTTKKLIKYLKAYSKKLANNLYDNITSEVDSKLDTLRNSIPNTVQGIVNDKVSSINSDIASIRNSLNNKANESHTHEISEVNNLTNQITSLNTSLTNKANTKDLTDHKTDKNNPHNVTLEQLGYDDSVKVVRLHSKFMLVKRHNVVQLIINNWDWHGIWWSGEVAKWNYVMNIPEGFKPVNLGSEDVKYIYCSNLNSAHFRLRLHCETGILYGFYNGAGDTSKFYGVMTWITGD